MTHPIRDPKVQEDVERASRILESYSWGEVSVKFRLKDGRWVASNVSITFPRSGSTE